MKQVFVIHGGDAFPSYEEYFAWLQAFQIDDPRVRTKGWKSLLAENLGDEYQIIAPRMPNASNAKYAEWKLWLEKHFPFLDDGLILVGHSLGAIFLAKYLSENTFPKKILGTFLVAGPYDADGDRPIVEFNLPPSLARLVEQAGKVYIYQSKDDPIVHFTELAKYQHALPTATVRALDGRGHFDGDDFPEIVADIKSLS